MLYLIENDGTKEVKTILEHPDAHLDLDKIEKEWYDRQEMADELYDKRIRDANFIDYLIKKLGFKSVSYKECPVL